MRVFELMTRDVAYCRPEESLARAANLMWNDDCGCVPVVDGERHVVGIVTDRDVCMAALHTGSPLHELLVTQAMARHPVCVKPEDDIVLAQDVMRQARVRRLPVTDARDRLIGLLSLHDLARHAARERRLFTGLRLRDVGLTFARISRPWSKPDMPTTDGDVAYAE